MTYEFPRAEALRQPSIAAPGVESLLDTNPENSAWPKEILKHPKLQEQAENRRALSARLDALFERLPQPEMELHDALAAGLVSEHEIAGLYSDFSSFFEEDTANGRALLYLPFELLPSQEVQPDTEELMEATARFSRVVKQAWEALLLRHDVRANFVDGDVLEIIHRTEPLPRVVKAAHLIPVFLKRGLVSLQEVIARIENTPDSLLADSIADTLPIAADMGLVTEEILEYMSQSPNRLVSNMAKLLRAYDAPPSSSPEAEPVAPDLANILADAEKDFERIRSDHEQEQPDKTAARNQWLRQRALQNSTETHAHKIQAALSSRQLTPDDITSCLTSRQDLPSTLTLIQAVQNSLERLAKENVIEAATQYSAYAPTLTALWENSASNEVRGKIESALYHFYDLHIIDRDLLGQFKLVPPALNASSSERMRGMEKELAALNAFVQAAEKEPTLSKMIYSAAILLGSRLKGYARKDADVDVAVFVRPHVPFEERAQLQDLMRKASKNNPLECQPLEFWLEEHSGELRVRDFENSDAALGDSSLTHALLGAWCGNTSVIQELHAKLLAGYIYSKEKTILGQDARNMWLEEMEHNMLQYRLLHTGYRRFFPEHGNIHTTHSEAIDGQSTFYDSGYRRLATQLFLKRVFLPQLEKPTGT